MSEEHSTRHIVQSLVVNLLIAASKGVAAAWTGSGSMLAETIHSAADCGNQLLLLLGVKRAAKPPDAHHPLGYGRALYFWSFMVALLLFCGGGVFSVYEGLHKMGHPEPLEHLGFGVVILLFSLGLEGYSTLSNIREMNTRRGSLPFLSYLRQTKDSDLIVVFGENLSASLGLVVALVAVALAWWTGESRYDGLGSIAIGSILLAISLLLAIEIQSLLLGESASPEIRAVVEDIVQSDPDVTGLLHLVSVQQGPGQVLLLLKLCFAEELPFERLAAAIDRFEGQVRGARPEVKWCFIEPDVRRA